MALGPYAFSSLFNTDESSRGECWKTMGLTLPPLLHPPIYPAPPPGRGQRMGKPIIFQNVISVFLPISHLDWIQIPLLPVSLLAKAPNVNSKLTFFFFSFSISLQFPALYWHSFYIKWVWMSSDLWDSPFGCFCLPSGGQTVYRFTGMYEDASWTVGISGVCGTVPLNSKPVKQFQAKKSCVLTRSNP